MNNDYDLIAPFYDRLAGLIFGNAQIQAQEWLIQFIRLRSRILIVGGGTGWILDKIAERYQEGFDIVYVEKSAKMLDLSRQRHCARNKIEFLHADISTCKSEQPFDAIITGFLFDNFSEPFAREVFSRLSAQLSPEGLWLHTDFETGAHSRLTHRFMLKAMYWFFDVLCNVKTSKLPDMKLLFSSASYQQLDAKTFYQGFIRSYAYKKAN